MWTPLKESEMCVMFLFLSKGAIQIELLTYLHKNNYVKTCMSGSFTTSSELRVSPRSYCHVITTQPTKHQTIFIWLRSLLWIPLFFRN